MAKKRRSVRPRRGGAATAAGPARDAAHRLRRTSLALEAAAAVSAAALICVIARGLWLRMRLVYAGYDDEGFLLISLRKFFDGLPLYSHTFTQYGPGFYWWQLASFHLAGLPVTHDSQRILSIAWVALTIAAQSATVFLASGSWTAAAAGSFLLGRWIYPQITEPGHPNTLIFTLLSLHALVYSILRRMSGHSRAGWFAFGALAAVLSTIKPHLAVIVVAPALLAEGSNPANRLSRLARLCCLSAAVLFPLLLMGPVLRGVGMYCLICVAVLSALGLAETVSPRPVELPGGPTGLRHAALAAALTGAGVLAATWLHGTSLRAMLEGMVTRPAEFARTWYFPLHFARPVFISLACSVLFLGLFLALRRRYGAAVWLEDALLVARLAWTALLLETLLDSRFAGRAEWIGLPHAWCWLHLPFRQEAMEQKTARARRLLAWLAGLTTPYAFPVPGTQLVLVYGFLLPLAAIVWGDVLTRLMPDNPGMESRRPSGRRLLRTAANCAGALAVLLVSLHRNSSSADRESFESRPALRDPGSRNLRMSLDQAADYTFIAENLRGHCDRFFSVPGINSLHFWSAVLPRHGWNLTAWMNLLRSDEQAAVARHLDAPHACIVWSERWLKFWTRGADLRNGPIADAVRSGFEPWETAGDFVLLMPRGRSPEAVYLLAGTAAFDGQTCLAVPGAKVWRPQEGRLSLEFRTRAGGTILSCQDSDVVATQPSGSSTLALLSIGADGRLRSSLGGLTGPLSSPYRVDDGVWHRAVLQWNREGAELAVDGAEMRISRVDSNAGGFRYCLIGAGTAAGWPQEGSGNSFFRGELRSLVAARPPISAARTAPSAAGFAGEEDRANRRVAALGSPVRLTVADSGGLPVH